MKTENIKSIEHEVGYLILLTITLVMLSVLVSPLFLALLPVAIIAGCREIWHLDHLKNNKHQTT